MRTGALTLAGDLACDRADLVGEPAGGATDGERLQDETDDEHDEQQRYQQKDQPDEEPDGHEQRCYTDGSAPRATRRC
jgi:hypothetical protein